MVERSSGRAGNATGSTSLDDAVVLARDARLEYNTVRRHEAIAWNRPQEEHLGLANPLIPKFQTKEILPTP